MIDNLKALGIIAGVCILAYALEFLKTFDTGLIYHWAFNF